MKIGVTRIHRGATIPRYETDDSAGFDLSSVADVTVQPGKIALVPTGLVVRVPQRMFLGIFARSSTPVKKGLMIANGVGVIDPDYCGAADEVKIAVLNFTAEPVLVKAGDRLAQGIFLQAPRVEWVEAEPRRRSRGGFGATGR
jgi:dUTP pyrophosphatase